MISTDEDDADSAALMEKVRVAMFGDGRPRTDIAIYVLVRVLAATATAAKRGNREGCLALEQDIIDVLVKWKVLERVQ
jgi:hypothetical protein